EEKPKAKEEEKKDEKPKTAEQPKEEKPKTEEKEQKNAAPPQVEKKAEPVEAGVSPAQPARLPPQREEARVKASPVARRIVAELGVDLFSWKRESPDGRVTETDVRSAAKSKQ